MASKPAGDLPRFGAQVPRGSNLTCDDPRWARAEIENASVETVPWLFNKDKAGRTNMRSFLLIASAILTFAGTMTFETNDANAVVCARGVYRAGCAGARGAVVVGHPPVVAACRMVVVNGVRVRRCV
jgi:hypothetical protein